MHKRGCPGDHYQGEVLCEVNGIPVLVRNEGGQVRAPKGLEGIAAYFESRGIPEDVYSQQCQVCMSEDVEHHFCDDCLYEDDIQHIRIELPNGPSFRFRVPEGWDPDVSAHGLTDAGHTILSVEREEGDEYRNELPSNL